MAIAYTRAFYFPVLQRRHSFFFLKIRDLAFGLTFNTMFSVEIAARCEFPLLRRTKPIRFNKGNSQRTAKPIYNEDLIFETVNVSTFTICKSTPYKIFALGKGTVTLKSS